MTPYLKDRKIGKLSFDREIFKIYVKMMEHTGRQYQIVDRNDLLPHFLPIVNICPLPDMSKKKVLPYYDINIMEAETILKMGKRINVMWSGGIDSTSVLSSFLIAGAKPDQLYVTMTTDSIDEYPWFYHNIIDGKIEHSNFVTPIEQQLLSLSEDFVHVTGEHLGSYTGGIYHENEDHNASYKKYLDPEIVEFLSPSINACPRPIVNMSDYRWYTKIYLTWQGWHIRKFLLSDYFTNNLIHFGNNDLFHYWTLFTEDKEDWHFAKIGHKKIIFEYTKDEEYFRTKERQKSIITYNNSHIQGWWGALTKEPIDPLSTGIFIEDGKYIIR